MLAIKKAAESKIAADKAKKLAALAAAKKLK